jgi:putative transposase
MSRSASGTLENPGKNVRAKSALNRSILDQGWGEFRRQLEFKQAWRGGKVIVIPPQHTSQKCSCCGHTDKDNRLSQALFACIACGFEMNADINAARNILAAGHAVIVCGEDVRPKVVRQRTARATSVKQEPPEETWAAA